MGLFDNITGAVLGKIGGEQGGLSDLAESWVGKGENLPISAEQISSVLGSGAIADMAAKFGISPETLSAQIAQHLPKLIDRLTPDGKVEGESGNLLSTVLGMLK